ncbi:uncharacterized protein PAE49_010775 isoform 2-T2 [Odontesthes bonariensis]|uniref:uncharacterized protein LOC142389764 isoform X2 n=1 Tax=Odontesthes bonariensis TaxID=219752 RepID=UPI003F58A469
MFEMRFLAALVLLTSAECRLPLERRRTCRPVNNGPVGGQCPITLSSVPSKDPRLRYSECITLHVWMKADDFSQSPKIEFLSDPNLSEKIIFRPTLREKRKKGHKAPNEVLSKCHRHNNLTSWELVYNCSWAEANREFSATYSTNSTNCSVTYTVPEPRPDYSLSVNKSSKTISVSVESGDKVKARWCYEITDWHCKETDPPQLISQSALFQIPYLLPCVCVEVFYNYRDARRHKKCPFQNGSFVDVGDVLRASTVKVFKSNVTWTSKCPNSQLNISASLCWKQHEHLCIPVFDSTLDKRDGPTLIFNTSAVDKHPQMCVQFSTQGSCNISCLFQDIMSPWETYIGPGRQSISVFLTSSSPAKFSTQLCVLTEKGCTPMGTVHSVTVERNTSEKRINVPVYSLTEKPCVQVWQSHPALHGRRILCPDYAHHRWGVYAAAALLFLTVVVLFGFFIHRVTKNGGWLIIQKPLLLVCSSEDSTHVSAVCALASLLQEELGATVHTALWAQSSQRLAGSGPGVADLGPLPWLYGQWEAVRKAQGKVLIVWSPEAKRTYLKWRQERANIGKNESKKEDCRKASMTHEKIRVDADEDLKLSGRKLGKCKKEKAFTEFWDDEDRHSKKEPSTVIELVFVAALTSLEGVLQDCKAQGVAIVYFHGLCHNRDIPKVLRGVPRYCLPQDLSGLIQELGEVSKGPKTGEFSGHCWPRLLSKVLSIWLARQLAQRLQTLLPHMQGHKGEGLSVASSATMTSDQTQSRHKFSPATRLRSAQEQELLPRSSWRTEKL